MTSPASLINIKAASSQSVEVRPAVVLEELSAAGFYRGGEAPQPPGYDNEMGFANRMVDLAVHVGKLLS